MFGISNEKRKQRDRIELLEMFLIDIHGHLAQKQQEIDEMNTRIEILEKEVYHLRNAQVGESSPVE